MALLVSYTLDSERGWVPGCIFLSSVSDAVFCPLWCSAPLSHRASSPPSGNQVASSSLVKQVQQEQQREQARTPHAARGFATLEPHLSQQPRLRLRSVRLALLQRSVSHAARCCCAVRRCQLSLSARAVSFENENAHVMLSAAPGSACPCPARRRLEGVVRHLK